MTIYDVPRESIGSDDEYFGLGPEPDHSNGMMLDDEGEGRKVGRVADGQGHSRPSTAAKSRPNSAHLKSAPPSPAKSAKVAVLSSDDRQEVASWTRVCMSLNNHSEIGVRNENKNENKVLPRILNACIVYMWFSLSFSFSFSLPLSRKFRHKSGTNKENICMQQVLREKPCQMEIRINDVAHTVLLLAFKETAIREEWVNAAKAVVWLPVLCAQSET